MTNRPEAGPGKMAYGARATFGSQILTRAPIYVWPREQRPRDGKGRHGSLHVKCAVADGSQLLISSANLTGYAMELNMEMGLLVRQQELSRRIEEHFAALVERGVLVPCPAL